LPFKKSPLAKFPRTREASTVTAKYLNDLILHDRAAVSLQFDNVFARK
jgi:hypothetical protein